MIKWFGGRQVGTHSLLDAQNMQGNQKGELETVSGLM